MTHLSLNLVNFDGAALIGAILKSAESPQACGYFASCLVFLTFWMQQMGWLRIVAICSNIAFFVYAVRLGLAPIAVLHASLLPINIWRLAQLRARAPGSPAGGGASGRAGPWPKKYRRLICSNDACARLGRSFAIKPAKTGRLTLIPNRPAAAPTIKVCGMERG